MAGEKGVRSKSKHGNVQRWTKYKDGKTTGKFCPRCGTGIFLGEHKDRTSCGKCGYGERKVKQK